MRIWSVHPCYLDAKGLVALWRETLLAQHVLAERTKGYRQHPQLQRFRAADDPQAAINAYLLAVYDEAELRGYRFDKAKIAVPHVHTSLAVSTGQVAYEWQHLLAKLQLRAPELYERYRHVKTPELHPLFVLVEGPIADWEVIKPSSRQTII